jgi:hypothetical protein
MFVFIIRDTAPMAGAGTSVSAAGTVSIFYFLYFPPFSLFWGCFSAIRDTGPMEGAGTLISAAGTVFIF